MRIGMGYDVHKLTEDRKLIMEQEKTDKILQNKNIVFYRKMLLVLGLERLLKFYLQKNKKSS